MSVGLVTITMWIVMTAFGAVVSLANVWDARDDLKYQVGKHDHRWQRALIARVNMANEIMRVIAHVLLFVAGVIVVVTTQLVPNPSPANLYVRSVILLTIAILVSQTLVHRWLRHKLKRPR